MKLLENQLCSMLYRLFNQPTLTDAISGGLYKYKRPDNSDKEDVVINILSIDHEMPQRAIANVNIHVKDIRVRENGAEYDAPDVIRLAELTEKVSFIVDHETLEGVSVYILSNTLVEDASVSQHYQNVRLQIINNQPN